jgi:hypothetical protein
MTALRRLWVPVLVGLLVAVLLGVGSGGVLAAEPRTVRAARIMIPAAAFVHEEGHVEIPDYNFPNDGDRLTTHDDGGVFQTALVFPVQEVKITRITVYAEDSRRDTQLCVSLYRSRAGLGQSDTVLQGEICTADSINNPQVITTATSQTLRTVNTAIHGSYLRVEIDPFDGLYGPSLYGVQITYTYEITP